MDDTRAARRWRWAGLTVCAIFLASIARLYHPQYGFTGLIAFPEGGRFEHPALAALPHPTYPAQFTYDGQYYAQLALEPLLRDPAIDRALDQPPYRARRILFSWTAWLAGAGRPWWVLQAYALQNVVCWLLLASLLTRWLPLDSGRHVALWTAVLFSHGLLWSVRFSLLDGPSLLLLAAAAALAERGGQLRLAALLGIAALGRETNLLGAAMLRSPRSVRDAARACAAVALLIVPLAVWQDYLWSIYRTTSLAGGGQLTWPFVSYVETWRASLALVWRDGVSSPGVRSLLVVLSLTVQLGFVLRTPRPAQPWWRLALAFGSLMLLVHPVVWHGHPGAITRVVLPLTAGFNILLARHTGRSFWVWFAAGNLHLVPARFFFVS